MLCVYNSTGTTYTYSTPGYTVSTDRASYIYPDGIFRRHGRDGGAAGRHVARRLDDAAAGSAELEGAVAEVRKSERCGRKVVGVRSRRRANLRV